jgi:hypothetical protein
MPETDSLKRLYKCLTGKGALPLQPTDPYYVAIQEATPEKDPILSLWHRIDMAESESINLLTGFRGNGKSTELLRLKDMLERSGCQVFLVNMLDYVFMTKPLELSDFILSLMASLANRIEESMAPLAPLSKSYWERLYGFLTTEVDLEKIDVGVNAPGAAAKLGFKLKTDSEFKSRVQRHLEGHLTQMMEDARQFVDGLVVEIRNHTKDPDKKVVLLVDSMEQLRGVGEDAEKIYASVVELFSGQSANLYFPKLHVVYTVPPYLTTLAHNLGRSLGGNPITQWPNIHVRDVKNMKDEKGLKLMESILTKRFSGWQNFIPKEIISRLAEVSGGDLRDFFRLIRECVISLRTSRFSNSDALLDPVSIERVIRQLQNELLPIADEDARWLARIHTTKKAALKTEKDLPSLARFLDSNLIMNYINGESWYDVHPLLVEEIMNRDDTEDGQRK